MSRRQRIHRQQRRAARAAAAVPPLGVDLRLPDNCPADVRELARMLAAEGPRMLAGRDPAAVGLLASTDNSGRPAIARVARERLIALCDQVGLPRLDREGSFLALVVGKQQAGLAYLSAPREAA